MTAIHKSESLVLPDRWSCAHRRVVSNRSLVLPDLNFMKPHIFPQTTAGAGACGGGGKFRGVSSLAGLVAA
jgi:hypothetical protein